jgi:hypothetical protein
MNEMPQFKAGIQQQAKLLYVGFVFSWGSKGGKFKLDVPAEEYYLWLLFFRIHFKYFWQDNGNVEIKPHTVHTCNQMCPNRNSIPQFRLIGSLPFHRGFNADEVDKG